MIKEFLDLPFNGKFHLEMMREAIEKREKNGEDYEITCISPVCWLQDSFAEERKNSDWKKFEDVRKHIENINVIPAKEASLTFDVITLMDWGVYRLTKNGGWDSTSLFNTMSIKTPEDIKEIHELIK